MSDLFSRMEAKAQGDEAAYLPPQARPAWGGDAADLVEIEEPFSVPMPAPRVEAQPALPASAPASLPLAQEKGERGVVPLAPTAPARAEAPPMSERVETVQVSETQLEKTRVETREITREIIRELRLVAPPPQARPVPVASMEAPTEVQPPPPLTPQAAPTPPVAKLVATAPAPATQRQASAPPEGAALAQVPAPKPAAHRVHIGHIKVIAPPPPAPAPVAVPMPQAAAAAPAGSALKSYLGWRP